MVHWESYGEGPAIVFLHAMLLGKYEWSHSMFHFARTHRVIVLDHRGHGRSERGDGGWSIREMSSDLVSVLDRANVDRAVLAGNSMGGMIAVQTALDAPKRVRALVVVSSATNLAPMIPQEAWRAYEENFERTFGVMTEMALSERTKRERPEVRQMIEGSMRATPDFARTGRGCMHDPGGVFHWNVRDRLREIACPTLVLAGAEDRAVPIEATRTLATAIPNATFEIVPDVAHYFPLERPADFNARIDAFLNTIATR